MRSIECETNSAIFRVLRAFFRCSRAHAGTLDGSHSSESSNAVNPRARNLATVSSVSILRAFGRAAMARTISVGRAASVGPGWLLGGRFDAGFLLGIPTLAIGSGAMVLADERFFLPVLLADLWLLGHRHVAESLGRLRGEGAPGNRARLLAAGLPLLLVAAIGGIAVGVAAWLPATVYFYLQWFRSTRQSWAAMQLYRRRAARGADLGDRSLLAALFCLTPIWGLLHRSAQPHAAFMGLDLHLMAVPATFADAVGIAACGAFGLWIVERAIAWSERRLPLAHTLCVLSHLAVFAVAYGLIADVTVGWLVAAIWYHAQYLAMTWLRHRQRGGGTGDPRTPGITRLVARRQLGLYSIVALASLAAVVLGHAALSVVLPAATLLYLAVDLQQVALDLAMPRPGLLPETIATGGRN
jgi:hypothetical protein